MQRTRPADRPACSPRCRVTPRLTHAHDTAASAAMASVHRPRTRRPSSRAHRRAARRQWEHGGTAPRGPRHAGAARAATHGARHAGRGIGPQRGLGAAKKNSPLLVVVFFLLCCQQACSQHVQAGTLCCASRVRVLLCPVPRPRGGEHTQLGCVVDVLVRTCPHGARVVKESSFHTILTVIKLIDRIKFCEFLCNAVWKFSSENLQLLCSFATEVQFTR